MTPWTVTRQAPLSMELSRQENWIRIPFPPPGDLNPGIKAESLASLALEAGFFTTAPLGKPNLGLPSCYITHCMFKYHLAVFLLFSGNLDSENNTKIC